MNVHDLLTPADCVPPVLCPPVSPAEGVYAWIGINFVLGRFDHADEGEREGVQKPLFSITSKVDSVEVCQPPDSFDKSIVLPVRTQELLLCLNQLDRYIM